jgi:phosphohistidine phosphatase
MVLSSSIEVNASGSGFMQLILWRHAQAEDTSTSLGDLRHRDWARELTLQGEKQARRAAQWLRPRLPPNTQVLVSPAIRTVQTAQQLTADFERVDALAPEASVADVLKAAGWPGSDDQTVVVVGHQPTLGAVAYYLLTGNDGDLAVRKSAVWWFQSASGGRAGGTALRAVFDPSMG